VKIWGRQRFVNFESGLNSCIRQIPASLDDDPENPRDIDTLPRRGYGFMAPLHDVPRESWLARFGVIYKNGTSRWVHGKLESVRQGNTALGT
jgi:hypothetical protein